MHIYDKLNSKNVIKQLWKLVLITKIICLVNCSPSGNTTNVDAPSSTQIALLVPLESQSNKTNNVSNNLINSARLAVEDLKHLNLVLTVYPTSGEAKRAVYAAKAAIDRGAQIIVGPLFSEETAFIKSSMKNTNIKIISLSNDPSVAGENVFIMGTTFQTAADTVVKFALSQGINRLAIVGPDGSVGQNGLRAAEIAVEKNGGVLTSTAKYPLTVKGIRNSAPKIYELLKKSNPSGLIFTDSPTRGLGFISEQLQQLYDNDKKKPPQFMGLTRWDSTEQILSESSLQKGWFVVPNQKFIEPYNERYLTTFGNKPNGFASLAYDAIALIGAILETNNVNGNTDKFDKKYFLDTNGFVGINGIFRFQPDGTNERLLSIAEVTPDSYVIIEQAKNKF